MPKSLRELTVKIIFEPSRVKETFLISSYEALMPLKKGIVENHGKIDSKTCCGFFADEQKE